MSGRYAVILVPSTAHAIRGEQILHRAGINVTLVPVPRSISSDCGVCLRLEVGDAPSAREALEKADMEVEGVHEI